MELNELKDFIKEVVQSLLNEKKHNKINPNYLKGYSGKKRSARKKEIEKRAKEPHTDPHSYRPFKTDTNPKTGKPYETKPSKYNKKFEKMFGK
jgi:hypothetical protein